MHLKKENWIKKVICKFCIILFQSRTSTPPIEGVFFDGQIFDAYALVCDLIQKARKRIVLIDNYADYTVLRQLDKRSDGVSAVVYTSDKNKKKLFAFSRLEEMSADELLSRIDNYIP